MKNAVNVAVHWLSLVYVPTSRYVSSHIPVKVQCTSNACGAALPRMLVPVIGPPASQCAPKTESVVPLSANRKLPMLKLTAVKGPQVHEKIGRGLFVYVPT